jgi:hypothetical protein
MKDYRLIVAQEGLPLSLSICNPHLAEEEGGYTVRTLRRRRRLHGQNSGRCHGTS